MIPNKRGRDTVLMRRSWREGQRVRKETLLNLTDFPDAVIRVLIPSCGVAPPFAVSVTPSPSPVPCRMGMSRLFSVWPGEPGLTRSCTASAAACVISPSRPLSPG